jgi:hypothetical protein
MTKELSVTIVKNQIGKLHENLITEDAIKEVTKLVEDPDYGEEFIQIYLDHLNILRDFPSQDHGHYVNALKFFSLVEGGNNLTNAYCKVFPERLAERERKYPGEGYERIRSEASRFNKTKMVNEIRTVSGIPVQLIYRHLLHEAILESAKLMREARSEIVRQKAAQTLIQELKPSEAHQINVKVDDGSSSMIEELRKAAESLAAAERMSVLAGRPLKEIAEARIIEGESEVVDD